MEYETVFQYKKLNRRINNINCNCVMTKKAMKKGCSRSKNRRIKEGAARPRQLPPGEVPSGKLSVLPIPELRR
jgi:hypothetical protein